MLRQIRVALLCYKQYRAIPLLFTVAFCAVYYITGHDAVAAITGKVATTLCVGYFIALLHPGRLFYYYNLHISFATLALLFISFDILLFIACLWATHHCL